MAGPSDDIRREKDRSTVPSVLSSHHKDKWCRGSNSELNWVNWNDRNSGHLWSTCFIMIWLFRLLVCLLWVFFFFFGEVKMHYVIFPSLGNLPRSHSCYIIVLGFNPIYVRPQSPVLKHYNVTLLWQSIGRKMSSYLSCVYIYGMYMVAELRQHTLTCRKWTCRNYFQAFRQR